MQRLVFAEKGFWQRLARLREGFEPAGIWFKNADRIRLVSRIIEEVWQEGDRAVLRYTKEFDGLELTPTNLRVDKSEIDLALESIDEKVKTALEYAIERVRSYQGHIKVLKEEPLTYEGITLRTLYTPLKRIGICVPAAAAPLPSTLIMSAVPAMVAGVEEIAVISPPRFNGSVHPLILACCGLLGIDEVYKVGGAQGVAALGLGTPSIKKVDKIVGPGNIYVQIAKKLLFGIVDIDSFAGPSEIVVLADDTAKADLVAADLIGQAEHNPGVGILVSDCLELTERVLDRIEVLSERIGRRGELAVECLQKYGCAVITDNIDQAIEVVNRIAPEHLSVQTRNSRQIAERCIAGAIFIGPYTSEACGDYIAGPSHVLPTGATARFFSPLNVMDFVRQTSLIEYSKDALRADLPYIEVLAGLEDLPGHLLSVRVRLEEGD